MELNGQIYPTPTLIETPMGSVEYAVFGTGPAVLSLHGGDWMGQQMTLQ